MKYAASNNWDKLHANNINNMVDLIYYLKTYVASNVARKISILVINKIETIHQNKYDYLLEIVSIIQVIKQKITENYSIITIITHNHFYVELQNKQ